MRLSRSRAFTLIELLVAVALLVIFTSVVVFVFSKAVRIFILADARAQIYQNVRAGVDMIRQDLMTAEPLLRSDDGTAISNLQRLRITNGSYNNTKWATSYPADVLQVWNLKSTLADGNTGSVYAKYWLDTAANAEVPILKRLTVPVNATPGSDWLTKDDDNPPTGNFLFTTSTSDVREELMQFVVGFDVEPYYTNYVGPVARDPHWNLAHDANDPGAFDPDDPATGVNNFRDANDVLARLWIIPTDTSGVDQFASAYNPWTDPDGAGPIPPVFNITSLTTPNFARKGAFRATQPMVPADLIPVPGVEYVRLVPALPRAFRITFYVRDEHSNEQRAIQQTLWMPMWGS